MGDQTATYHLIGDGADFINAAAYAHPPGFAAPAGMDLRLDYPAPAAYFFCDTGRLFIGMHHASLRNWNCVVLE